MNSDLIHVQGGPGAHVALPAPLLSGLDRRAKAAIVVRLLLNDGADIPLEDLPEDLQARLTTQMGSMRLVDRMTLDAVAHEFASELEQVGLAFKGGIAGALDSLDGKISPITAARLRREAGVKQTGDPWARLRAMDPDALLKLLKSESVEVSAVVLSKLDTARAAELLGKLPGPEARNIAYAVSRTEAVSPDAVNRIGLSLASQMDDQPLRAFDSDPVARVGAILNSSTTLTRDDVLTGLDETDAGFATRVRKAIFTFSDIPERIAPQDLSRVLRDVDQADLIKALGGAPAVGMSATADFILDNISGRMADMLREEIEEAKTIKPADAETAMFAIITNIRRMEAAGDLELLSPEAEDTAE